MSDGLSPSDQEYIKSIESVRVNFLSKVAGTEHINHWERLKLLHLYSQERRRERYMIIFLWKIAEGHVKGYTLEFTDCDNGRRGRMAISRPYVRTAPAAVRRAREGSLGIKGSRLFNLVPSHIRNMSRCTVDTFKKHLDEFLAEVPDQSTLPVMARATETNC